MARPLKEIDGDQVRELASIGCSYDEMEVILKASHQTLIRRFGQAIKEGRANLKMSLRRRQYQTAMTDGPGSTTMQIWLGKQYLEQSDKSEVSETKKVDFGNLDRPSTESRTVN